MIDLNKEAEEYAHNYFVMQDTHYNGLKEGYAAGATSSKYVEQKILEAQIAENESILEMLKVHGDGRNRLPVRCRIIDLQEALHKLSVQ